MKTLHRVLAALAGLGFAAVLVAAATARLVGKVVDSAGNPIEGVTITVTTKSLQAFKLVLKTDKKGGYATILNDGTIPYHLKFEKEGYVPFEGDKKIPVNDTGGIDAHMVKVSEAQGSPAAPSATEVAVATYNEGVDLMQAGNKSGAEAKFLAAVKKNPDLPAAWKALSVMAYERGDWAKTIEYGKQAVDLDPSPNMYSMLADAANKSGDKKAAAEYQAKYAEANPDTPEVLYNRGVEAYNGNKMKDAEDALTKAITVKPDYALAYFWLGMAEINLKKNGAAKGHFEKYLQLDPKGSEADTAKEMLSVLK